MKRSLPTGRNAPTQLLKIAMIAIMCLGGVGIVGVGFFFRHSVSVPEQKKIINDTNRYQEIRNKLWLNQNQVKHFPRQIPLTASNVHLAYSRGLLQGSSFFQVRFRLPNEQIDKLLSQYRAIAKNRYMGGNTNDHANLPNGVPTTFFYTGGSQEDSFPASYEILVLDANDRSSSGFQWHHGDSYGVAIDRSASEVVYWAEQW